MKVQCSCGAKHEFEISPVMVNSPVRFVCPACGLDSSEFVDVLVRRELGQTGTPSGVPVLIQISGQLVMPPIGTFIESPQAPPPASATPPRARIAARVHTP